MIQSAGKYPLNTRRRLLRAALGASASFGTTVLGGCGWHLRGDAAIPFKTIHVAFASSSTFGNELKRTLRAASSVVLVDDPQSAELIVTSQGELRYRDVLSLTSAARVREYRLHFALSFRAHDFKGNAFIPGERIDLTRDVSFNEGLVLAKEYEDALLYRDMQTDMVQQVLRRLAAIERPR